MKNKWAWFGLGFVSGIVFIFIVVGIIGSRSSRNDNLEVTEEKSKIVDLDNLTGVRLFDEPGDIIKEKSFKVSQVVDDYAALAHGAGDSGYYWDAIMYLLVNKDNKYYYDEEIVKVPSGKVVRQIGVFQYENRLGTNKTVPIVMFFDK